MHPELTACMSLLKMFQKMFFSQNTLYMYKPLRISDQFLYNFHVLWCPYMCCTLYNAIYSLQFHSRRQMGSTPDQLPSARHVRIVSPSKSSPLVHSYKALVSTEKLPLTTGSWVYMMSVSVTPSSGGQVALAACCASRGMKYYNKSSAYKESSTQVNDSYTHRHRACLEQVKISYSTLAIPDRNDTI